MLMCCNSTSRFAISSQTRRIWPVKSKPDWRDGEQTEGDAKTKRLGRERLLEVRGIGESVPGLPQKRS
jgi:hypothetical protein